jgi:hypothetical protein
MSVMSLERPSVSEPKRKRGRPESEIKTRPVRLRSDILRKAEWIAVYEDVNIGQLLSDILEPIIDRRYKAVKKPD